MLRRSRLIAVLLLAVLFADWCPGLPPLPGITLGQVRAQQVSPSLFGVGSQSAIWNSAASMTISNSTAATWLLAVPIPGSLYSTSAAPNFQSTNLGTANASLPLHIVLQGALDTIAAAGTINVGVNYGVGTTTNPRGLSPAVTPGSGANNGWFATMNLANAITPGSGVALVAQPIKLDVWVMPIATGTATNATPNITNTVYMHSRLEIPNNASGGIVNIPQILNASTIAQVNIASTHLLNIVWQFGTAGNYLRIYKVLIKEGE